MSLTPEKITNASVQMIIDEGGVSPIHTITNLNIPIKFTDVKNLQVRVGSYTPANDIKYIATGLAAISPNFIFLLVDGHVNFTADDGYISKIPVSRIFFTTLFPIFGGGSAVIDNFQFDGRTICALPMLQGVEINYTLIYGQADAS
jgi:hypothetical protein